MVSQLSEIVGTEWARLRRAISRYIGAAGLAVLAVVAGLEGLMMVLIGAYASLTPRWPAWQAGALTGGTALLLAVIVLWIVTRSVRRQPRAARGDETYLTSGQGRHSVEAAAGKALAGVLPKIDIRAKDVAVAALVAGLVMGASRDFRRRRGGKKPPG